MSEVYKRYYIRIAKFTDTSGKKRWLIMGIESVHNNIWVQFKLTVSELPKSLSISKAMSKLRYRIHIYRKRNGYEIRTWWHSTVPSSNQTFYLNDKVLETYLKLFRLCGLNLEKTSLKETIEKMKFLCRL